MSSVDNGGPAFPRADSISPDGTFWEAGNNGMTLRDWFAGQALAGYFANPSTPHRNATDCASYLYEMADAMIRERSK